MLPPASSQGGAGTLLSRTAEDSIERNTWPHAKIQIMVVVAEMKLTATTMVEVSGVIP